MSRCGNCGTSLGGCTCEFISSETAIVSGNGRSYAAINFRPTNVPLPRPYGLLTRRNSNQTISAAATAAVIFDTEFTEFEGNMTDVALAPTRLTAPVDGYYLTYGFAFPNQINGNLYIRKNGATNLGMQIGVAANAGIATMSLIDMVAGNYLELVFTAGTSNTDLLRSDTSPFLGQACYPQFWAQWVRPL